ncbi:MAG: hypothetical protein U1E05_08670 [Patescibacteria group bacterium]|nr:hypothetical protein [Patescibacteria group bacterium]
MSKAIDPYYQWLGIPPKQQPADHYRLLGIERFETNADVIRDAADRQMVHVRSYQMGQHSQLSQKVLNELANARVCLLNSEKKAAYDAALRAGMEARPVPVPVPAPIPVPVQGSAPVSVPRSVVLGPENGPIAPGACFTPFAPLLADGGVRLRSRRSMRRAVLGGVLGAVALSTLALLVWWGAGRETASPEPAAPSHAAAPVEPVEPEPVTSPPPPPPPPTASATIVPYADALRETATIGAVTVRVVSVELGKPRVVRRNGRIGAPAEEHLVIVLELENRDASKKVKYGGWGGGIHGNRGVNLMDSLQNSYPVKLFSAGIVEGQLRDVSLYPGEPLRDVLVFERPAAGVEFLRLSLPGDAVGQEGVARFEIPSRMYADGTVGREPRMAIVAAGTPSESRIDAPIDALVDAPVEPDSDAMQNVEEAVAQVAVAKHSPPALAEQKKMLVTVEELFDSAAAQSPGKKLALADRMAGYAKTAETADERFVLLRRASDLAAEAGEPSRVLQLVDLMAEEFEIDRLGAQAHLLNGMAGKVTSADQVQALVVGSAAIIDNALDAERFDLADSLSASVCRACQCPAGRPFRGEARERRREVEVTSEQWKQVQTARALLQTAPDDAGANTIVGEWLCLVRDEWDDGMPYLAKGAAPALTTLAQRELQGEPEDAMAQVELADTWWDFGKAADAEKAPAWLERAAYWYGRACANLESPLLKAKAEKRLAELGKTAEPAGTRELADLKRDHPGMFSSGGRQLSDLLEEGSANGSEGAATSSLASGNGEPCPACGGKGVIYHKCPNRQCARGTVRSYQIQVVGQNPVSGQTLTQRIAVRVPCPTCNGNYIQKQPCSECQGTGVK